MIFIFNKFVFLLFVPSLGRENGYTFTTVTEKNEGTCEAVLSRLKKYRKYGVVVQAFNEKGPGPMSPEVMATTLEDGKRRSGDSGVRGRSETKSAFSSPLQFPGRRQWPSSVSPRALRSYPSDGSHRRNWLRMVSYRATKSTTRM